MYEARLESPWTRLITPRVGNLWRCDDGLEVNVIYELTTSDDKIYSHVSKVQRKNITLSKTKIIIFIITLP